MGATSFLCWISCPSPCLNIQSNLDYSKCQGPHESFRIIGSSNDRKQEFSDIFGKARTFHRTSLFCQSSHPPSTRVFREVINIIRTSVKALKKMSFLEVVVSSSRMLCRSKNAEKKENPIFIDIYCMYIHVTTSIGAMKITVKCRLTNHLLAKYCLLLNRPNVIRSPFQLAHSVGPSTAHHG